MKKIISIFLCLMMLLCGGVGVFAAVPTGEIMPTAPRFVNILSIDQDVINSGSSFECKGVCKVAKYS